MSFRFRDLMLTAAAGGFWLACGTGNGGAPAAAAPAEQKQAPAAPAPPPPSSPAAVIPRPAPEFSVNLPNGSKTSIQELRGKVVPLIFVSTTCPHCHEVTRELNEIQREYGPKGVQIVMAAMDEKAPEVVQAYIQRFQPAYPMGWVPHQDALAFMQISLMAPGYVPKVAFIDRKGIIRSQYGGEEDFFKDAAKSFRAELDKLLGEPAGGKRKKK